MKTDAAGAVQGRRRAYVYPRFVRRAVCPKCGVAGPPKLVGELHLHRSGKSSAFVARTVREPLYPVAERSVEDAIARLDERWAGGVLVPSELLPLVSAA